MTRYRKVLLGLSAVLAVIPIYLTQFPHDFADIRTYSIYFLAIIPAVVTAFIAGRTKERKWAYRSVMVFWSVAALLTMLCLLAWPTDAWAPVLWYAASEGWLVGAALIAAIAVLVRHYGKRKEPNQPLDPTPLRGAGHL
jgi:MFS family permease